MTLYEKVKASMFSIVRLCVCKAYGVSIADAATKDTDEACEDRIHKIRGSYIFGIQKADTDVQVNFTVVLIDGTVKITRFTMFVRSVGGLFRECTTPFTDSVKDLVIKKLNELRDEPQVKIIPTSSSIIPNQLQEQLHKALLHLPSLKKYDLKKYDFSDIYDFSNKKESFSEWERKLGIRHQDFDLESWAKKECKKILRNQQEEWAIRNKVQCLTLPELKYCIDDLSILGKIPGADYDGDVISKEEIQNIIKGDNTMAIEKFVITPAVINEEIYNVAKEFFTHDRLMQIDMDFANSVRYVSINKDGYVSDIQKMLIIVTKRLELGVGTPVSSEPLSVDVHYSPVYNSFPEIAVEGAFPVLVLKAFRAELEKRMSWLSCVKFCRKPDNELELRLRKEQAAKARLLNAYNAKDAALKVDRVIANYPAVIVFWKDGSKTIVKAQNGEPFDIEKGVAMAFAKKALGNDYAAGGRFKAILKHVQIETKKEPKKKEEKEEEPVVVEASKNAKPKKADFIKSMVSQGFTKAEAERAWKGMTSKAK